MAFLGRYGHQSVDVVLDLPAAELKALASGIADIMREESDSLKQDTDD